MEHLLEQLADIERQMDDSTLSHSDQQLLDQAWDDINDQIEVLQMAEEYDDRTLTLSESESIHTLPKRPDTPIPTDVRMFVDLGNGYILAIEEITEEDRWREREAEGWVNEEHYDMAEEF
jgi:hypothetical protein